MRGAGSVTGMCSCVMGEQRTHRSARSSGQLSARALVIGIVEQERRICYGCRILTLSFAACAQRERLPCLSSSRSRHIVPERPHYTTTPLFDRPNFRVHVIATDIQQAPSHPQVNAFRGEGNMTGKST